MKGDAIISGMISNLTILIISLISPPAIVLGLMLFDVFLDTNLVGILFFLIFAEHVFIARLFGIELQRAPVLLIYSFPNNELILKATIFFDYLLVTVSVYILLIFLTRFFRSKLF